MINEKKIDMFQKFTKQISKYNIIVLLLLWILRTFEFITITNTQNLPTNIFHFVFKGYIFDILYSFIYTGVSLIPYYFLFIINSKIFKFIYFITTSTILTIYLALILFFKESLIPLDASILNYSFAEIKETIMASGSINIRIISYFIVLYIIIFGAFYLTRKKQLNIYLAYSIAVLSLVSVFFIKKSQPKRNNYKLDIEYYLSTNKLCYFIDKVYQYGNKPSSNTEFNTFNINKETILYHKINQQFNYTSKIYPLLHQSSDYQDKIGCFFNFTKEKPNIIIIIVESLAKAFSGKNAYLGSFTPFLDSLAEHSLYWENTLSTAERTFGALPSILASVPYGKKGFAFYRNRWPYHISLIEFLRKQSYYSSFYYGGWNYFQDMGYFLDFSNIDFMIENAWGKKYRKFEKDENGFTWGYPDNELFKKALEIEKINKKSPRLDIFLTLNMHNPFHPPHEKYYQNMFEQLLIQKNCTENEKNEYRKNKKQFVSILSTDDAIRYFFNEYKKRKEFKNTIFIITGDHRMGPIFHRSKIDKYHVPLIIYSPLLKTAKSFQNIASHLDITPTIACLLKNNFQADLPSAIHWIGNTLDTLTKLNNKRELAFIRNSRELTDYLSGNYYLSEGNLYKVQPNMQLTKVKDSTKQKELEKKLENFKFISLYVCENNRIYPQKEYLNFITYSKLYISRYFDKFNINKNEKKKIIIKKNLNNNISKGILVIKGAITYNTKIEKPIYLIAGIKNAKTGKITKLANIQLFANYEYTKQQGLRITKEIEIPPNKSKQIFMLWFYNPNGLEIETKGNFEFIN